MVFYHISIILFFLFSSFSQVEGQVCENVYPHLSCGLGYSTQLSCEGAGCCWDENPYSLHNCFAPKINGYSYTETEATPSSLKGDLTLLSSSGIFGPDFESLSVTITQETASRTHIQISPTYQNSPRWEVPSDLLPRPGGNYPFASADSQIILKTPSNEPMELLISRKENGTSTGEIIFYFSKMLVFQDQYIQFVLGTPQDTIASYGLGESTRLTQHLETNTTYTLWNTDYLAANLDSSLYGSHPFFIQVNEEGKAHGVFILNSNGMDVSVASSDTQGETLGFQITGGLIDIYVFSGPTPSKVIAQYLEVIGKPAMMPYWSLGYHNCRYGYPSVAYVQDVVTNHSNAKIPLETQWIDIDYMDRYRDFTFDANLFSQSEMSSFVNDLHKNNQKFVPIIDSGIYVRDELYPAYSRGLEQNVFVNDMTKKQPYLGQVWPGPTYFPDWFAVNTTAWWTNEIAEFHEQVAFDGLWIDMNEVSNFCNRNGKGQICVEDPSNACNTTTCCLNCSTIEATNTYDFPPFIPHVSGGSLGGSTISMNSYHAGDVLEYNAHNLFGLMKAVATLNALQTARPNQRAFMLTRSTFPGSGVYAAHWTGDNNSTWTDLQASIVTMNNLALFGIPMVGADICGFLGNTDEELCTRWIEVGAFSPFSRNQNGLGQIPQELYRWESVANASRNVIGLKYQLLAYLYTLIYNAHQTGSTVMNAMWMHFPTDSKTFFQDGQYMWSNSILFTPVITKGATSVSGYFPKGIWYSMFDSVMLNTTQEGIMVNLETPLEATNVHVRGGTIIPLQNTDNSAMTTTDARKTSFTLLVPLDNNWDASGSLYLDDGEQIALDEFSYIEYYASPVPGDDDSAGGIIQSTVINNTYTSSQILGSIIIKGVSSQQGISTSQPDDCTAIINYDSDIILLLPSISNYNGYSEMVISFDDLNINIVNDWSVTWSCSTKNKKKNNEDESGWDAIPTYGQALIISSIMIVLVALMLGGYKYYYIQTHKKASEPLLRTDNRGSL